MQVEALLCIKGHASKKVCFFTIKSITSVEKATKQNTKYFLTVINKNKFYLKFLVAELLII